MRTALIPLILLLGAGTDEPVRIDFWSGFTGPDGQHIQTLVDRFNRDHAGEIEVRMVVMLWADFYGKVALALRSRRAPDVGVVHYDQVRSVIEQGVVLELDPWMDRFPQDDYVPSALEVSVVDGRHYGIPLDFHPLVFYWNKDLFAEAGLDPESPPRNRAEFLEVCRRIQEARIERNGRRVQPCTITTDWPNFLLWQHIFFCNGGRMFSDDFTKACFDTPAGADALRFLHDLIHKWGYSPPNTQGHEGMETFRRGLSAMELNGIWMLPSFKETADLNFGARAMINLGTGEPAVLSGAHTMVLFRKRWMDPKKVEASIAFLKYISDNSLEWAKTGNIPTRYSLLADPAFAALPYLPSIAEDVDRFTFPDSHYRYTEGIQEMIRQINLCLLDKVAPKPAVEEAARVASLALSQDPD